MQPVVWDGHGVIRFQQNEIVRYLLDNGGLDLNKLHGTGHSAPRFLRSDWDQFHQLIGYSVSACPYLNDDVWSEAQERRDRLVAKYPDDPALEPESDGRDG